VRDDEAQLTERLGFHLRTHDVLILSGGVSMGRMDLVPKVLEKLGVGLVFHHVAQRPGKPMWFGVSQAGPAVFALRLGAPIVFGVAVRRPSGRYVLTFEAIDPVETGDREADVDRIVADYTLALERHVRGAPEQYFWHHRRWKHQRPGTPPELGDPL